MTKKETMESDFQIFWENTYLWGEQRYVHEVMYVFEDILPNCTYVPTEKLCDIDVSNGMIIVCAYEMEEHLRLLETEGLEDGKNYMAVHDLFHEMDKKFLRNCKSDGKEFAIWGCGQVAHKVGLADVADFYIDSNKEWEGKEFQGRKVVHPDLVKDWDNLYVLIAVGGKFLLEIREFLISKGLKFDETFFTVRSLPSEMLLKTLNDRPIKNFHCNMGMKKVDFSGDGSMHACCGARIGLSIGNLFHTTTLLDEWNSYRAKIVKLSLINNTYSFCSREKCAGLCAVKDKLQYWDLEYAGADYSNKGEKYPPLATICIDYSCNLKCESCRQDYKRISDDELEKRKYLSEKLKDQLMPYVDEVIMAGNGEMFYSPLYRDMWINNSEQKRKGIIVKSNGVLFNKQNWELLSNGYENISLDISIDGASKEVYETVRRGGNWDVLYNNMIFASELRKSGKLKSFSIEFVVQQKNYQDAVHFVELGKEWGCDRVIFARIYNWGTYDKDDFNSHITLFENNGTGKIKEEFRHYFMNSIFDDAIVKGISVFRA